MIPRDRTDHIYTSQVRQFFPGGHQGRRDQFSLQRHVGRSQRKGGLVVVAGVSWAMLRGGRRRIFREGLPIEKIPRKIPRTRPTLTDETDTTGRVFVENLAKSDATGLFRPIASTS